MIVLTFNLLGFIQDCILLKPTKRINETISIALLPLVNNLFSNSKHLKNRKRNKHLVVIFFAKKPDSKPATKLEQVS